ncbi:hypothetical protein KUV47_07180 [Vannielia litorea]|uniref:hypothetical protein n=1 Tax=Vannielia litorea TaxID=1217970 RepID=UPI001C949CD6|nr:hypothetical protein [Vannielia litorea]MBY6152986.1 hypothetical protein [Vannielia litorea]
MIALVAVAGVAEIIWKARRGRHRPHSHYRPDARDVEMYRHDPDVRHVKIESKSLDDAARENAAEDARHRRNAEARKKADAKAERARLLRPWDHH